MAGDKGGRPKKPAARRAREGGTARAGTVSHRPLPSTELVAIAGRNVPIAPPDDLPPPARELWVEIVQVLAEAGVIDRVDLPMLRWLCLEHARGQQAREVLDTPPSDNDLAELDRQIRNAETLLGALETQLANMLRAGLDVPPAKVNAAANYGQTLANLRSYRSTVAKVGNLVALGSTGQLVEHPLLATERAAANLVLRYAGRFGLTPSDRAALGIQILEGRTMKKELEDDIGRAATKPAS